MQCLPHWKHLPLHPALDNQQSTRFKNLHSATHVNYQLGSTSYYAGSICCFVGATRTDDSVHDHWMPSETVITARYGRTVPPNVIPFYVDSRIVDDDEAAFTKCQWAFIARTILLVLPALARETLPGTRLTVYLQTLRSYVLNSLARFSILVLCLSTTFRETLRPAVVRLQSMVGFVRPHHFRNVRHQDVSGKPRISKETRLPPTNTKTNRTAVRLRTGIVYNPIQLAVDRIADRVMLLSAVVDAHHMVNLRLTTVFRRSTLAWRLVRGCLLFGSLS
ncbi:hypothetical protein PHMEG_00015643 [Phytophthora megakarya]|uniref:Uncharacterized protein n=1 Tax=Phytophthora megakarya TaxID=4795 RepID=A0A225W2C2_9STRA|nr:hypothetical protein PHMEG_00015643 [Phytophthora megakarya]